MGLYDVLLLLLFQAYRFRLLIYKKDRNNELTLDEDGHLIVDNDLDEIANNFVNTQGPTEQITKKEIKRGLTLSDFLDKEGKVVTGFSLYLDAESRRKKIKYRYGISDSLELKLEIPFFLSIAFISPL